ncbi:MAG TPA: hypothetical protein VHE60_03690 [Pyrinomonadaceae bacterium]|nr:hypothetical protein [Pyrinomonadaceae bacterium]
MSDIDEVYGKTFGPPDEREIEARDHLRQFFNDDQESVFFSRQLEVLHEHQYFHWITNRAVRDLEAEGSIRSEWRKLSTGTSIKLVWHRGYRFYRRSASRLVSVVEEYSDPNIGAALGLHGETMVLEGFARNRFLMAGRNTRQYGEKVWGQTEHDLDFIFERDGMAYGIEVKNTLGYMDGKEFSLKIRLCRSLGIRPVFVCRMLPKSWIHELNQSGGFALVLKYQLYPWTHRELANRVRDELGLPVDAPRSLAEGTMARFLKWHAKQT